MTGSSLWRSWLLGLWLVLGCGAKREQASPAAALSRPALAFTAAREKLEAAPIALTASDGSGLQLVSLDARTVIEDPLAFTELHLVFRNPEPRRREGRFTITLPEQAAISRFAMRVNGALVEGEVVERRLAEVVYEELLHRREDPALLEKSAGNAFSARVFPIEASADKELVVAYSEELTSRADPYRLLLAGLPRVGSLRADVSLGSSTSTGLESSDRPRGAGEKLHFEATDFAPEGDLTVQLPARAPFALRSGELVVARVPVAPALAEEPLADLTVLVDSSASRALGYVGQLERLATLIGELSRRTPALRLRMLAFDQGVAAIYGGPASAFSLREQAALLERGAFGASDLAQALAHLAALGEPLGRILVVSDGVITAGEKQHSALREAVARLAAHGATRLDVLAEGGIRDAATLEAISRAGLRSHGVVIDGRASPTQIADKLAKGALAEAAVSVAGASSVEPSHFSALQAGDERLVFARLPVGAPVQISVAGAGRVTLPTLEVPAPLLERAMARAQIAALSAQLRSLPPARADERAERERRIVQLSTSQRVLSDYTSLLVLESAADYARYGIPEDSRASILEVGPEGLALAAPQRVIPAIAKGAPAEEELPDLGGFDGQPVDQLAEGGGARDDATRGGAAGQGASRAPSAEAAAQPASPSRSAGAAAPPASRASAESAAPAEPRARAEAAADVVADKAAREAPAARPAPDAPAGTPGSGSGAGEAPNGLGLSGIGAGGSGLGSAPVASSAGQPGCRIRLGDVAAEGLDAAEAARPLRQRLARLKICYEADLPDHDGVESLRIALTVDDKGLVAAADVVHGGVASQAAQRCMLNALVGLHLPKPDAARGIVTAAYTLERTLLAAAPQPALLPARPPGTARPARVRAVPAPRLEDAYEGDLAAVLAALATGDAGRAAELARAAHARDPGDVLALVALGEALEAQRELARAARVYGSIIDLFPMRADLRRMAGERLERLGELGLPLAIDSYREALALRPDHPSAHRLLAYALLRAQQPASAFDVLDRALDRAYRKDRFDGAERILRDDLGLVAAALLRTDPSAEARIDASLTRHGAVRDRAPSLRFVLNWETDANDVDFHIYDGRGGHAYYAAPRLASGGALYADITTGYGPECFSIPGRGRAYPYVLQAHYYARGPMGYGMGKLEVLEHDGEGALAFRELPFVVMKDKAFVELARITGPLQ